ncbi:piggyBac transposable element-derived protein 4-like [Dermacentor silvarum]|uniref:piggyBac transposable element-derived protein 4-like n=1 Tax=Dermacentor silvarum TaxID=543639 RepID=UPI002100C39E|nr:piggyBac transposable element-derived protein 4-like [Dermacentor silvarum]
MGNQTLKPKAILDCNHTMGGVDQADQMLSSYSVPRKRKKISNKKIFQHLLDGATYNSLIIYQKRGGRASHLDYRLKLIEAIITKYSCKSGTKKKGRPGCPLNIKRFAQRHLPSHIPATEKKQELTRRCVVCYMKRDGNGKNIRKETRIWCR